MKHLLSILTLIVFTACSEKLPDEVPPNLIDEEQMTTILTDVHLIEGARTGFTILGDTTANIRDYYEAMYEKHGVTRKQFDDSFAYYTKHPEQMDRMYEKVIENLTIIEARMKSENPEKGE